MTIRRLRNKISSDRTNTDNAKASSHQKRDALRRSLLESLEARHLMALGPQLIGVQPNNSDLIENGVVRNVAPRELTFRFDDSQIIDAATVGGIRVTRAGSDGSFALPSVSTDFGTNGRVDIQLTSRNAADLLTVNVTRSDLGASADPTISITGTVVNINLNSNPTGLVTAQRLVDLINSSGTVASRMQARINGGLSTTRIGAVATTSYSPIRLTSNNDIVVQPGAVVIGDRPNENEVTLRFAENLPDDMYRLEVFGFDDAGRGIRGLRNTDGQFFVPSNPNTRQDTIDFRLDLGTKVTAVVPQPVVRNADQSLSQQRNVIVVYFDNDKLLVENGPDGKPTARSVENPEFYQLIYTADSVRNTDDLPAFLPTSVVYNASANTATLRFDTDIDSLPGSFLPSSTFRLRIGTRETAPIAPVRSEASAVAISDLNTNGGAKVRFTSKVLGEAGSGISVTFVNNTPSAQPTVTVNGTNVRVDLGSATVTVNQVIQALENNPASAALIKTTLEPGSNGALVIGNRAINYSPVVLYGMGSSFDTATNLGTIGSSSVAQTSLLLTSAIDPEEHVLDLLGASDDPGQRIASESMENHINPNFGADDYNGIRTIYYNFQANYGAAATNSITEKQKERIREAFALWSNYLGVQFVESANSGLTMALGAISALSALPGTTVEQNGTWGVRIDPTYQNGLAIFSASNAWEDNYGEDMTRSSAAAIGMLLGLARAGNLAPSELMNLDPGFLNFPPTADRNFEPVFPGNQDILHGQYVHRPEGSDIDLYRFDVDFGPDGQTREGVLVAETFAERSLNSSTLDTRLALYKQTQATATSNLGAGQNIQLDFTAVKPGKLGNNLQIFITRSNRGAGALPIVNTFPNAITIDLNSTVGSESTLGQLVSALDNNPAARALVKVRLASGASSTVIGNRDINYSPIVLKGGSVDLISQNDNYFSQDSLIRMNLTSGVYYIGVSSSGNDQYDATVQNTGTGGRTEGKYDLRLTFRAQTDSDDSIQDVAGVGGDTQLAIDGDGDGTPGGVYNFWFETSPLDRIMRFTAGGSADLEGRTITLTGGNGVVRVFEFSSDTTIGIGNTRIAYNNNSTPSDLANALTSAINSRTELGVTASFNGARITLRGERKVELSQGLTIVELNGKTIFVDKLAGPNADGSLARPFNNIAGIGVANAFGSTVPGDIVRIVGNGGNDRRLDTVNDNFAYEVGFGALAGSVLADGTTMDVPKGVTVMVDAGAIFKMNRSRIGVGSSTLGIDRSGGALQVLGAPILLDDAGNAIKNSSGQTVPGSVYFTSWFDESIGLDNYQPRTTPSAGNWGGLVFKRDLDKAAGRFDLEDEGIFRQYVNHADIRYGGSNAVVVDSIQQTVNSIQIADMRPTLTYNRITLGADAAISATPDSFQETLFSEPAYQRKGSFTPDYSRVGPEMHDNILVNNSINGVFIKVSTPAGGQVKQLTVPGRFDDSDMVHVISENVSIQGKPGAGLLDSTILASNNVSGRGRTGGTLSQGTYNYKFTFVDVNGYETPPSDATQNIVVAPGQNAISITGLPSVGGEFVSRRLYRSTGSGSGPYRLVAELDGLSTSYEDLGVTLADVNDDKATLLRDRPDVRTVISQASAGGTMASGTYTYRMVMVDEMGRESLASASTSAITIGGANRSIRLTNIPLTQVGYSYRRIYRSDVGGAGTFTLVAEIRDPSSTSFLDTGVVLDRTLAVDTLGTVRPRLDASLVVDPGMIIKLEGARIEIGHSAQLLAEGVDGQRVVFTSKQDDRFGIGGTFDTNNNGVNANNDSRAGDWSGIYASPGSTLQLDHAQFSYAGGISRIEGTFKAFSPIELQQANARIAHSTFENNANGIGGQGALDRLGRPANENYPLGNNASRGSTLFMRGTQPIILDNIFQNNAGSAMTIDANSMDAKLRGDTGRQSGEIDRVLTLDANRGPLFRGNRLFNNGINGLEIRGDYSTNNRDESVLAVRDLQQNVLTTESVWDDTDIVHVLFDSITVSNLEHSGGLRLQSAINESLVIKLEGQGSNFDKERGTGITATGRYGATTDRVGGTVQILGQPGFPVVMTSLRDDTVGAGTQPDGRPQTDTNNDGIATIPRAGDWRSAYFDSFSNDRNVLTVMEIEPVNIVAPGTNDSSLTAQLLGTLAPNESTTDENLPLGFVVHGVLSEPTDQDVYSFVATAGTEVWFDVDNTRYSLNTILEVLDANGNLLARSDDSTDEQAGLTDIFTTPILGNPDLANPLIRRASAVTRRNESGILKDDYTQNTGDAGLRLLLPGVRGATSTFFFRVRSKSTNIDNSAAGLTSGSYDVQIRIRDKQEFAGSTVQFADIRYATNGVNTVGLPFHSPLTGEANTRMFDGDNDTLGAVRLGSLQLTDRNAISVAGDLQGAGNLMEFSIGDQSLLRPNGNTTYPVVIDVDYADGLNRPDLTAVLYYPDGRVVVGRDSTIADDQPGPLRDLDFADMSRGSAGTKDPFIGTVNLPAGDYALAIGTSTSMPTTIARNTVLFDDSHETLNYSPIRTPINGVFINRALANTNYATNNAYWWRQFTVAQGAHGGTQAFGFHFGDPGKSTTQGPGELLSNTFTFPNTWDANDPIRMSFNYQFPFGAAAAGDILRVTLRNITAGTDAGSFDIPYSADWANRVIDLSNFYSPNATFQVAFNYILPQGGALSAASGVLMDDFYVGTWTPRYTPNSNYASVVNDPINQTSTLFPNSSLGTGQNLWYIKTNLPPSQLYSSAGVLAFESNGGRQMSAGASGRVVSQNIDLTNQVGSTLYFSYDFNPHDNNETFEAFYRVNGVDTLVASSRPTAGVPVLKRTQGQWDQARVDLTQFQGAVGQLVFSYNTNGANTDTQDTGHAYVDNIIVGDQSRGEEVTNTTSMRTFITTAAVTGVYQVEIRKGDVVQPGAGYTRGSDSTSIQFNPGLVIADKSVVEMSDGANRIKFQFTYDGSFDFGNIPITISGTMSNSELAARFRDAVNSMFQQNRWRVTAANSNGTVTGSAGLNSLINLFGDVEIVSGESVFGPNGVLEFNGIADKNVHRDQGQFVINASTIKNSRDYGIWSAPADLYYENGTLGGNLYSVPAPNYFPNYEGANAFGAPWLGAAYARKLPVLNTVPFQVNPGSVAERAGVAPGLVVTNNILVGGGLGGIHAEGQAPLWRIATALIGANEGDPTVSSTDPPDHFGTYVDDRDLIVVDYGRQKIRYEFEDIAGSGTGSPAFGSGTVGGNGWEADNVPIYYREDGGAVYMRADPLNPGYTAGETIKAIRDAVIGSMLQTNGTTQHVNSWFEPQAAVIPGPDPTDPATGAVFPGASMIIEGPQLIEFINRNGGGNPFTIRQVGEYPAAPFMRVVNNTIFGNDGRASFNASTADTAANSTIAGATETWLGTGTNTAPYVVNGTLNADPLSTGSSDVDIFKIHLEIGERVLIDVDTADTDTLDSALKIFDANGKAQVLGAFLDPTTSDSQAAPGETTGKDPYVDFTATKAGDYYVAISSTGNTTYDPLSLADRLRGRTSGTYNMSIRVLKADSFVITVEDPASYADGDTFTIEQVADLPGGTGTRTRTFEFTRTGTVQAGNVPVYIGPEYRVPDVARAIAGAINAAGMLNVQNLDNGSLGVANPLAPVSAIALGGIGGFSPGTDIPTVNNGDFGINSGNARGPEIQAGLNYNRGRFDTGWNNDDSVDKVVGIAGTTFRGHANRGFGHDRTMSLPFVADGPVTSLGNGTSEKYVIIRNAAALISNGNVRVDKDQAANNNLNQVIPESGVMVSGGATPTILNNVFQNVQTPVVREFTAGGRSIRPSAVVLGGSVYQYYETRQAFAYLGQPVETPPTNVANTASDFNTIASDTARLFVNATGGNFLPYTGADGLNSSIVIDSSIDSLPERELYKTMKAAVGIAPSPILAPERDHGGQLRSDEPNVSSPSGLGGNVFKDRGALDRADFIGPTAVTVNPVDNDAPGVDTDITQSVMQLKGGVYPEFRIQLKDGFETSNLQAGTGIDDNSVTGREGGNRLPGSVVTITENGRLLVEGIDYVFSYNSTTNEIVLKPLAGVWKNDRVYDITLNNKDRFVINAPAGDQVGDGDTFTILDSSGGNVTFEFDSGYRIQIPQGIELIVPLAGGGAGGVNDGDRFTIENGTTSFTFEFDNNNNSISGNIRVPFTSLSTRLDIANAMIAAMAAVPNVVPKVINNGNVFIGSVLGAYADTTDAPALSQPRSTQAILMPALGTRPGGITDGQTFVVSDGRNSFVFEFDADQSVQPGNIRIDISSASTANEVATVVANVLRNSGLALSPQVVDGDKVYLGLPNSGRVDLVNSRLRNVSVSRSLVDGQSIEISRTVGNVTTTKVFELDSNGTVAAGSIAVPISVSDTQSDIGIRLAAAITAANLGLAPEHVGDGNIFIGGTTEHSVSVANAPSIGLFGRPGVQTNTTLDIFGTLLLQIPSRGGVDIADNSFFTITNNNRTVTFEFDSNFSGPSAANNVVISYTSASTAADIAATLMTLIANSNLGITPRDAGLGRIDLGLLQNSAVNPLSSAVTLSRGSVADGDFFTINNGTVSATFEFENLSIGDGRVPSRIPIRYNNQSSRAEVFAAMKAAIESAGLGLTTVIGSDGLKLLDNARYTTNIDGAPSLLLKGVPGGSIAIGFVQDQSFDSIEMRDSIVRAINDAFAAGRSPLQAKVRGGSTLYVENAVSISPNIASFYLRGIADLAGNFLKSNRINNETQFTILMPGTLLDFGDAPDPVTTTPGRYPTLMSADGARHVANATALRLGAQISPDNDGKPTPRADGDVGDDGVTFQFQNLNRPIFNRNVDTTITVTLSTAGFVDGWIDFNADGDWDDPGEKILDGVSFTASTLSQEFQVRVPSTVTVPATGINSFARFRASTAGNLLPTGLALDGEVEDYLVRIIPGTPPTGVPDVYTMNEDQVGGLVASDATGLVTPNFRVDDGVLANDISPDGRPLLARNTVPPQHVQASTFVFDSTGTFVYKPTSDYFGSDTFVYLSYVTIDAGENEILEALMPTTVTINIRPVNDAPTANNFSRATDEDVPLTLSESDVLTFSGATAGPANESDQRLRVSLPNLVSANGGSLQLSNGGIVYTPRTDFSGTDTFTYTLTDNGFTGDLLDPQSVTRTVTVTVRDKNDPPITTTKTLTVEEDGSATRAVAFFTAGDLPGPSSESGQTLTFSGVVPQSDRGGTVSFANGQVTYRPAPDFNGEDRFYYLITDNGTSQGVADPQTSRGTVIVTVTSVNDAPRIVKPFGTETMVEDEAERTLTFSDYFFDPDVVPNADVLTYAVVSNSNPSLIEPTFNSTSLFLRPKADQNGQAVIVIEATDLAGNKVRNTLTVVVTPVGDAPRVSSPIPNQSVAEDAVIPDIVLSPNHFVDPDAINGDVLTFEVINSNPDVVSASIVDGKLRLVLVPDASGLSTITVRATDRAGNMVEDSFDLTITPVNDAPRVTDDLFYVTPQGVALRTTDPRGTITTTNLDDGVLANDSDIEGNTFTARLAVAPTKGTVTINADGTFTYTPNAGTLKGEVDTFQYEAVDSLGAVSSRARVNITIANPPPPLHQNASQRLDVDADGFISPIDVLLIINFLNFNGASVPVAGLPAPPPYRDVNGNNIIEPLDVLEIINYINNRSNSGGGEGEGESKVAANGTPLVWSSNVMRESPNLGTTMVLVDKPKETGTAAPLYQGDSSTIPVMSSDDFLACLASEAEEEADRLATQLASSPTSDDENESLDSFFAEVFGG